MTTKNGAPTWAEHLTNPIFHAEGRSGAVLSFASALLMHALRSGMTLHTATGAGIHEDFDELLAKLDELLPSHCISAERQEHAHDVRTFIDDVTIVQLVHQPSDGFAKWLILTLSKDLCAAFADFFGERLTAPSSRGRVYVLVRSMSGYELQSAGSAGVALERGNYTGEVLAAFDHTVAEIGSASPAGRLTLIDGPPGTGKTFFVTGLVEALPDPIFVVIPPDMVAQLAAPDLVGTLLNFREWGGRPMIAHSVGTPTPPVKSSSTMVLIVEDADHCLLPRGTDNMGSVSSLLNLSDGILGRLLDLRVIATTNAKIKEVDSALLRPGRLSAQIKIDKLTEAHASHVAQRLGHVGPVGRSMTLAEVYDLVALR